MFQRFGRADFLGLVDWQAQFERFHLHGGRSQLLAATRGAVGLRDHGSDGVTLLMQRFEGGRRERAAYP